MGQTTSNIAKKVTKWATGEGDASSGDPANIQSLAKTSFNPFVYKRMSQKYKDADGDIAHEFYEQQRVTYKTPNGKRKKSKIVLRKVPANELQPVGMEELSHPSINVNYPLVLCEASMVRPA